MPLPGAGLLQLQERLVEIIATAFIRQTRFDPRRKAITEQQLYDSLPDALRALGRDSEANIEVNGYRARINRGELLAAGQRLFESARDAMGTLNPGDRLIADPVAGLLPGLAEQLPGLEVLAPDSVRIALEQHMDLLVQREQALSFVTALPSLAPRSASGRSRARGHRAGSTDTGQARRHPPAGGPQGQAPGRRQREPGRRLDAAAHCDRLAVGGGGSRQCWSTALPLGRSSPWAAVTPSGWVTGRSYS